MWGNIIKHKKNAIQSSRKSSIKKAIKQGGWKTATSSTNKWGIKHTNPTNKETKNKLSKPNKAALEEPGWKNTINLKRVSVKNLNSPYKEGVQNPGKN